jgi:hypothetical protein
LEVATMGAGTTGAGGEAVAMEEAPQAVVDLVMAARGKERVVAAMDGGARAEGMVAAALVVATAMVREEETAAGRVAAERVLEQPVAVAEVAAKEAAAAMAVAETAAGKVEATQAAVAMVAGELAWEVSHRTHMRSTPAGRLGVTGTESRGALGTQAVKWTRGCR